MVKGGIIRASQSHRILSSWAPPSRQVKQAVEKLRAGKKVDSAKVRALLYPERRADPPDLPCSVRPSFPPSRPPSLPQAEQNYEALKKYGHDLVADAEESKLDPVIGRDEEIRRVIQVEGGRREGKRRAGKGVCVLRLRA
jgi:ATP-dependent Clp protease ATP-binding subunit ClpA